MTDLEMDLVIANTRIKQLEMELDDALARQSKKCSFGAGVTIKPDGIHELDACDYEVMEVRENVTVEVLRCRKCGHVEVSWYTQEDGDFDG